MIVVTGASGHLGRLVISQLLEKVPPQQIVAAVRNPEKAAELAARGVQVRKADYDQPETLDAAFAGADKILLISSSEVGKRAAQHKAAIEAAKKAKPKLLAYTSVLHCDTSGISLAVEHKATEEMIRASGIPYVFLRNGWYIENYTENLAPALQHGALVGCAGEGKIAAATREDFAAAAATVLLGSGHENKIYELAGDAPFTMSELASELSTQTGKSIAYKDVPAETYQGILSGAGLPAPVVEMLVSADQGIARGELTDSNGALGRLIGRRTTPLPTAIASALKR